MTRDCSEGNTPASKANRPEGRADGNARNAVHALATSKKMPPEWLAGPVGLRGGGGGRVLIPYFDEDGAEELFVRVRNPEGREPRFYYQTSGVKPRPYGLWRLD